MNGALPRLLRHLHLQQTRPDGRLPPVLLHGIHRRIRGQADLPVCGGGPGGRRSRPPGKKPMTPPQHRPIDLRRRRDRRQTRQNGRLHRAPTRTTPTCAAPRCSYSSAQRPSLRPGAAQVAGRGMVLQASRPSRGTCPLRPLSAPTTVRSSPSRRCWCRARRRTSSAWRSP